VRLTIPELSLVVLIGPSGSGKSTFARTHFRPTEVLSSDACRALVSDDEADQDATAGAFIVLHAVAHERLKRGRLTVIDATNVQPEARRPLVELARAHHVLPVAIVLDLPEKLCLERNRPRRERDFGPRVVRMQRSQLHRSLRNLGREGFRSVEVLKTPEEVSAVEIERQPLWCDRRSDRGPFDVIGDVHGCAAGACPSSGPWRCGSSRWGSRPLNASSAASLCAGCTSASSASWRWRASRSIRGCERAARRSRARWDRPSAKEAGSSRRRKPQRRSLGLETRNQEHPRRLDPAQAAVVGEKRLAPRPLGHGELADTGEGRRDLRHGRAGPEAR